MTYTDEFVDQAQEHNDFVYVTTEDLVRYQHQFGDCDYDCGNCPGQAEAEAEYQAEAWWLWREENPEEAARQDAVQNASYAAEAARLAAYVDPWGTFGSDLQPPPF